MSNSSLVNYINLSPNNSGPRTHNIDRITPHCVVGQCSVETLGNIFASSSRQASCNYGIGADGRVLLCVDEGNRSWCSSSNSNDQRAVTIECASDKTSPYAFNSVVYDKLIDLCVDICKRNGKNKLLWLGDKNTTLNYSPKSNEMVLTVHRWFANKSCPGDWLMARMGDLASKVTSRLNGGTSTTATTQTSGLYRVQLGAFQSKQNAERLLNTVKQKGFEAFITQSGGLYKVQVGAFSVKANADSMLNKVKAAGLQGFISGGGSTPAPATSTPTARIVTGSSVRLRSGAKTYTGGSLASFVYQRTYKVLQINGDRVVISYNGSVVAAVHLSDLTLA